MKFNQTPHPLIEDHYHIQELINAQEKRSADRQYHRDRIKSVDERNEDIIEAKPFVLTEFWCDRCGKDFKAQAVKQVEEDWTNGMQKIAFYKTKCFQGHWCIRLITDRVRDSFYQKSKLVAKDRANHMLDIMQPDEIGFHLMYGKK